VQVSHSFSARGELHIVSEDASRFDFLISFDFCLFMYFTTLAKTVRKKSSVEVDLRTIIKIHRNGDIERVNFILYKFYPK
jgi:hypothetical protein